MNDRERQRLLDRVHQPSGTVGRSIPETLELDGESIPVRECYFDVADEDTEEAQRRVEEVLWYLRRKRRKLLQRIREDEMSYETGEEVAGTVQELDRAINAFESVEDPDFGEQLRQERIESAEGLLELMRNAG